MWVGVLGALAGATRSTGVLLLLPALMLYLYGPREDRLPDYPRLRAAAVGGAGETGARGVGRGHGCALGLRPRYRLRRDALWLGLMPAGVVRVLRLSGPRRGGRAGALPRPATWGRHFAGPYVGVWDGLKAAFDGGAAAAFLPAAHMLLLAAARQPVRQRRATT